MLGWKMYMPIGLAQWVGGMLVRGQGVRIVPEPSALVGTSLWLSCISILVAGEESRALSLDSFLRRASTIRKELRLG